jgi:hypothetical protein
MIYDQRQICAHKHPAGLRIELEFWKLENVRRTEIYRNPLESEKPVGTWQENIVGVRCYHRNGMSLGSTAVASASGRGGMTKQPEHRRNTSVQVHASVRDLRDE